MEHHGADEIKVVIEWHEGTVAVSDARTPGLG
jgi:hypothetical protein